MTSRIQCMENSLDYCRDRGEQYVGKANESDLWHDLLQKIDKMLNTVDQKLPAEKQIKKRIAVIQSRAFNGKLIVHPQALRRAMAPNLIQEVLNQCDAYEDVIEAQRENLASIICSSFCKVFAILLKFDKVNSIAEFIKLGINDSNLPLQGKHVGEKFGICLNDNLFVCVEDWEESDWENFFHWQWNFLTPFFARPNGKVLHYQLKSRDILPIVERDDFKSEEKDGQEDESGPLKIKRNFAPYGGNSTVSKIKLDPLSYDFGEFRFRHRNDWYALKQLTEQASWKDFLAEVYVWRLFNEKGGDKLHMSPLICTFERTNDDGKTQYFLLFPWASGDLKHFLKDNLNDNSQYTSDWMIEQCWRLAQTLSVIHHDQEDNNPPKPGDNNEQLYGRHGDIKPDNILLYADYIGCENAGTLVLADFGIAKCHRLLTKSMSNPLAVKHSPTYRAPEFDVGGYKIGRKSDIWGLACTYIEFVTWYLKGWQAGNCEFAEYRDEVDPLNENFSQDTYFSIFKGVAIVKPQVVKWMRILREDDRCKLSLCEFICFIEQRMLVVDPSKRATAHEVSEKLEILCGRYLNDNVCANSHRRDVQQALEQA